MTTQKLTALSAICALALGVAGCDPGSDSVEANGRAAGTSGSEAAKPDENEFDDDDFGDEVTPAEAEAEAESEGLIDDDTFGEEGLIDDDTFGEEGLIDDDL